MQLQINVENKSPVELKLELLEQSLLKIKTSSDNVRKGMFARHCALAQMYLQIKDEYEKQKLLIDDLKRSLEVKNGYQYLQGQGSALYNVGITERSEDGFIGMLKERRRDTEGSDAKCISIGA